MWIKSHSILIVVLALSFTNGCVRQNQRIHFFEGTMKEAITKAKSEHKYVFFDAYASWCGPCKAMDEEVFTDKDVANFFNQHFVSVHNDMERGEGPELANKYASIDGYPSLLFLNSDGMVIKTLLGSRSSEKLLAEAKLVVD